MAAAARPDRIRDDAITFATIAGLGLALIGWTDLILLWFPARPSNPEWEFGAASAFFDALPLATIGLALLVLTSILNQRSGLLRLLSVLCWIKAIVFGAILFLFALGLPLAIRAVQGPMRSVLLLSITKTLILAAIYIALYLWIALASGRSAQSAGEERSRRRRPADRPDAA